MPAGQATVLLAAQYQPAGHDVTGLTVWPGGQKVPAAQGRHEAEDAMPGVDEYEPAGHGTQAAAEVAPVEGPKVPAGQLTHVALVEAPVELEKVPSGHAAGGAPAPGQKKPAGQVCELSDAPSGQ